MAYGDLKIFLEDSSKVLRDKTFIIAKNVKYDEYQRSLASMAYNFFDKNILLPMHSQRP